MRLVLVRMPSRCARTTAAFTSGAAPKSSAVTTSRRAVTPGRRSTGAGQGAGGPAPSPPARRPARARGAHHGDGRSEEHTSELQSQSNLVCRLLLEKKKKRRHTTTAY